MDKGRTQTNEPMDKKADDYADPYVGEMTKTGYMCQEKKEEEDSLG